MELNMKYAAAALLIASAITSCQPGKDDPITPPQPPNEQEVITTLILNFDNTGAGADKELRFTDADGDGGGVPVLDVDTLDASSVYNVSILVLNETANPVDTISNEILDEGVDHQFFFTPMGPNIGYVYADVDVDGNPIGLLTTMTTGALSSGTFKVTLLHALDKNAAGVSGGDMTNAGGETDLEVTFPLVIE